MILAGPDRKFNIDIPEMFYFFPDSKSSILVYNTLKVSQAEVTFGLVGLLLGFGFGLLGLIP